MRMMGADIEELMLMEVFFVYKIQAMRRSLLDEQPAPGSTDSEVTSGMVAASVTVEPSSEVASPIEES